MKKRTLGPQIVFGQESHPLLREQGLHLISQGDWI
jgi:hypothetical protein